MSCGNEVYLSFPELVEILADVFAKNGVTRDSAALLAANCASCERDGSASHGVFRMPGYVASLRSGWVDGAAEPILENTAPALLRCDAKNGFAQVALEAAKPLLLEKIKETGVALLSIRNSHHFSALWPDVEPFADQGLMALSVVNSMACVAPHGGRKPVLGTNPLAFACPVAGFRPFVFDQASSAIAHGDLLIAANEGRQLAPDQALNLAGEPTTDPNAVLCGGTLLPFGGHKGASIALMVEVLSAALSGGAFSHQVDWTDFPGAQTPRTGQFLLLIDGRRGNPTDFQMRLRGLLEVVKEAGQDRLPGERRFAYRSLAQSRGIPLSRRQLEDLRELAIRQRMHPAH
ncbi:Ldh family oxidoreductase [Bradyrhizobium sp. KB893862 SZCCT0404]|uniref:Ldh family oxidoreductase n=1 Tax=Bradyrhizobium sp. KB893862 SZCCT0404 TaxID=2807672 RepID=UPI001BA66716|nr:Ldh family oxidoreductase [Bradyrhizobium sp. KB893862 SZCCT0404]MBR1175223.1 Ldh family oxidoreductase [Bradyrhizobium sp. KB893862 SZCCT0404]